MKLAAKRFTPLLLNIPEEDSKLPTETSKKITLNVSRQNSVVSLKRENSRKKLCTGCPGCETNKSVYVEAKLSEIPAMFGCRTCTSSTNENKQRSIRKWLEDVPILQDDSTTIHNDTLIKSPKRVRSPTRISPDRMSSTKSNNRSLPNNSECLSKDSSFQTQNALVGNHFYHKKPLIEENIYDTVSEDDHTMLSGYSSPEKLSKFTKTDGITQKMDTSNKKQINATIRESSVQNSFIVPHLEHTIDPNANLDIEYDTDSLERKKNEGEK